MNDINRETLLDKVVKVITEQKYISVPEIQIKTGVSYKCVRLLFADLLESGTVKYDSGVNYQVTYNMKNTRRGVSVFINDEQEYERDKNVSSLSLLYSNLRYSKTEIEQAFERAEPSKNTTDEDNAAAPKTLFEEMRARLSRMAINKDEEEEEDEDDEEEEDDEFADWDEKDFEEIVFPPIDEELDGEFMEEEDDEYEDFISDEYNELSDRAKKLLCALVKEHPLFDRNQMRNLLIAMREQNIRRGIVETECGEIIDALSKMIDVIFEMIVDWIKSKD